MTASTAAHPRKIYWEVIAPHSEDEVAVKLSQHIDEHYPDVLYHFDFGSGTKLSITQAKRQTSLNGAWRGWSDLLIAKKVTMMVPAKNGSMKPAHYGGLFIELKKDGVKVFKKDGELVVDNHIREQADIIARLRKAGYKAEFAAGYEEAKQLIDEYLGGKNV